MCVLVFKSFRSSKSFKGFKVSRSRAACFKLLGFAIAIEDGADEHWQDGVDEPYQQYRQGYASRIVAKRIENYQ